VSLHGDAPVKTEPQRLSVQLGIEEQETTGLDFQTDPATDLRGPVAHEWESEENYYRPFNCPLICVERACCCDPLCFWLTSFLNITPPLSVWLSLKALVFVWALFYAPQCPPLIEESPAASHLKVQRREGNRREKIFGHPICDRGGERQRILAGQGCR
jgi:hypothetical protein